jgi:predicted DCC family thiol-disulfide oxidoreductase YuxK
MTLSDIRTAWNRFFHEPIPPTSLGLYRVFFGLMLLAYAALISSDLLVWYGDKGVLPLASSSHISGGTGFNLLRYLPNTGVTVQIFFGIFTLAAFCMTIGFGTRIASIVLFFFLTSLHHRNTMLLNSGDFFLRIAAFWMMFADSSRSFSVDRLIRLARGKETGSPAWVTPWPLRMIQLQLAMLYLGTFLWKARGEMWLDGTAIYYTSRLAEFWRFPTPYFFEHMWTIKLATWGTLAIEFALGALLWIKDLRYWILLGGVLLHAGIDWTMNIPLFAPIMITAYITWVDPADLERAFAWIRQQVNRRTKFAIQLPVFYDGMCSFCTRSVEILSRFDSLRRVHWIDMHSHEAKAEYPDLDLDRGANEMLLRLPDGRWLGGFDAFRKLAKHFPIFWLILPLLYIPPIPQIGRAVYKRIAARRYCILPPPPAPSMKPKTESQAALSK